jgi:predicted N-acetyltransferase YhbS
VRVEGLGRKAFVDMKYSDHSEHKLVRKLRRSKAYIPDLSLIAQYRGQIIGHILISKIEVVDLEQSFEGLSLAPISVSPEYQNNGIGTQLIVRVHEVANTLGYGFIVLIGHKEYYPRLGYQEAKHIGVEFPFEAPSEHCMILELNSGNLPEIQGTVKYPKEFFE